MQLLSSAARTVIPSTSSRLASHVAFVPIYHFVGTLGTLAGARPRIYLQDQPVHVGFHQECILFRQSYLN